MILPPDVPAEFVKFSATSSSLTVAWTALPLGVVARVQLQLAGGDWSVINDLAPATSPCTLDGLSGSALVADTAYDVRIRAENSAGESDWVVLAGLLTAPPTPSDFNATSGGYGIVNLSWTDHLGYDYQLYRDNTLLNTSIGSPYADDLGAPSVTAYYQITASTSAGTSDRNPALVATSGVGAGPSNAVAAVITGDTDPVIPGSVLSVSTPGTWSGDPSPSMVGGQWYRDGSLLSGQTGTSYTAVSDDVGHAITYVETYSNVLGSADGSSNAQTVYALLPPVCLSSPVIDGGYVEGQTVYLVNHGTWSGNPTSYAYTWYADASPVAYGETSVVTSSIATYYCVVTASNDAGSTDATSNTEYASAPA